VMTNRELVSEFEQGRVAGDFRHADHVRVAYAYVAELPLLDAVAKFSAALRRFASARGKPNLYHETITWAYLFLIAERMARAERQESWEEFAARNADLLLWKDGVLDRYYADATLESDLARRQFIMPEAGLAHRNTAH